MLILGLNTPISGSFQVEAAPNFYWKHKFSPWAQPGTEYIYNMSGMPHDFSISEKPSGILLAPDYTTVQAWAEDRKFCCGRGTSTPPVYQRQCLIVQNF